MNIGMSISKILSHFLPDGPDKPRPLDRVLAAVAHIQKQFDPLKLSRGELQRILYLCELNAMGLGQKSLMDGLLFHATVFGPQCKELDRKLALYRETDDRRFNSLIAVTLDPEQKAAIESLCRFLKRKIAHQSVNSLGGMLVAITQSRDSAWAQVWVEGIDIPITEEIMSMELTSLKRPLS